MPLGTILVLVGSIVIPGSNENNRTYGNVFVVLGELGIEGSMGLLGLLRPVG